MTATKYTFTAKNGTQFSFDNYIDFATWFFGMYRRILVASFDSETFKRMNYLACKSKEARKSAI